MIKKLCVAIIMLLNAPFLLAKDPGLLSYDDFLESRNLKRGDVACINEIREPVFNPRNQVPEPDKKICEVWIPEKVIPAQVIPAKRLTFADGSQVYMTVHEWQDTVPTTENVSKSGEFVVREDKEEITEKTSRSFKRYIVKNTQNRN